MAWEAEALKLLITPPEGGTREAAALCQSITWGGSYDQAARTLDFPLLVCPEDKRLPAVDCPPGSRVQFYRGETLLFDGFVFSRQRDTLSNTVEVSCADRGLYLKRNQGRTASAARPLRASRGGWRRTSG